MQNIMAMPTLQKTEIRANGERLMHLYTCNENEILRLLIAYAGSSKTK